MNESIEQTLAQLHARNRRVEADKAWETSKFRIGIIVVITYIVSVIVMYVIKVDRYYLSALIPTIGFLLSTLSLPVLKRWWVKKYYEKV